MESSYPWGEPFQLRLLAYQLREPQKALNLVEPGFFTSPMMVDISRNIRDVFKSHPNESILISKTTLKELVKESLGRKGREHWPAYRRMIRRIYKTKLKDKEVLVDQAKKFVRENRYREALVKAERAVSARKYGQVHEVFEQLKSFDVPDGLQSWEWRNLPKLSDFPPKEVLWLVDGVIPEQSALALSGDEGVGKTIFCLSLSRSLTEGIDFQGRRVFQTPVLYLGLDVSQVTLQSYLRAMRWEPNKYFRILTMWTGEDKQPPMLDDAVQMEKLYAIAREKQPVMIFDTLRDFFEGEENSSTDTKPVLDAVRKLRSLGATIILIVHPPKSGNSLIRGTGNISQKLDIPYLMARDKWQGKDVVILTCPKKNRFGSTHFNLAMRQLFIPIPATDPFLLIKEVKDWKPSGNRKQQDTNVDVIQYVKDHPGTNQKQIQEALKMGDRSVRTALSEAKDDGILKSVGGSRKELRWYDVENEDAVAKDVLVEDMVKELGPISKTS